MLGQLPAGLALDRAEQALEVAPGPACRRGSERANSRPNRASSPSSSARPPLTSSDAAMLASLAGEAELTSAAQADSTVGLGRLGRCRLMAPSRRLGRPGSRRLGPMRFT